MSEMKRVLVTGATGKVGQTLIKHLLAEKKYDSFVIRALCHNREPEANARIEIVRGSIEHCDTVEKALDGVTHVIHLA